MDKLKKIIMDNLKDVISCEMISNTNNIVFKVITKEEILYAKVYNNKSSHIDHELNLYSLVDLKYLKELVLIIDEPKIAIFKEVNGITIDELTDEQLLLYSKKIIDNLCNFFSQVSKQKNDGYGLLDENMKGNK